MRTATLATLGFLLASTALGKDKPYVELDAKRFDAFITGTPAVVQFYAVWDKGRKAYQKEFEAFCAGAQVRCGVVDVDKEFALAQQYDALTTRPTAVFFKDGARKGDVKGAAPREDLEAKANELYGQ